MWCGRRQRLCKVQLLTAVCCVAVHCYVALSLAGGRGKSLRPPPGGAAPLLSMSPLRYAMPEPPPEGGIRDPSRGRRNDSSSGNRKNVPNGNEKNVPIGDKTSRNAPSNSSDGGILKAKPNEVTQSLVLNPDLRVQALNGQTFGKNLGDFGTQKKVVEDILRLRGKEAADMLMFADLKAHQKEEKKKPRIFYDLSAKAKKEGKIGPFIDTKRTLKFNTESSKNDTEKVGQLLDEMISVSYYDSLSHVSEMLGIPRLLPVAQKPDRNKTLSLAFLHPTTKTLEPKDLNKSKTKSAAFHTATTESRRASGMAEVTKQGANSKTIKNSSLKPLAKVQEMQRRNLAHKPSVRKTYKPPRLSHELDAAETSLNEAQIVELKQEIVTINEEQKIANEEAFGPVEKNCTIIVVQVHRRVLTLRELVRSLTTALQGAEVLVIFSHDFWSEDLNAVVGNVTAFRTMQIFFPFSLQLHPHVFPGLDPRDCVWDHRRSPWQMRMKNLTICQNEKWPDSYGHYREARYTQLKHHWWWNKFRVFDELRVTREWTGVALFLEDDHYVAPDALHVLRLLINMADKMADKMAGNKRNKMAGNKNNKESPSGRFFALGTSAKFNSKNDRNVVYLETLGSPKLNTGIAFDRAGWTEIKKWANFFCSYDDYNWDWTLARLMRRDPRLEGRALAVRPSRVFHMSSCGTHAVAANCDKVSPAASVLRKLQEVKPLLFPTSLQLKFAVRSKGRKEGNGGWGDRRDIELCLAMANGTAEATLQSLQHLPSL